MTEITTPQKKSLWIFGTRELFISVAGAALFALLAFGINMLILPGFGIVSIYPAAAIPMFFGIAFGPIVGFITGFFGNLVGDLLLRYGFLPWWDLGNGLLGLITGLIAFSFIRFRDVRAILKAELFVVLGVFFGIGIASLSEVWVSELSISDTITQNFLPEAVSYVVNGLILVPILMVVYDAIVTRRR